MFSLIQFAIKRFTNEEKGQALTEYGLILALVSVGLIAGLLALTGALGDVFNVIMNAFPSAPATTTT